MPRFDDNLEPIITNEPNDGFLPAINPASDRPESNFVNPSSIGLSTSKKDLSFDDVMNMPVTDTPGREPSSISFGELNANKRYDFYRQGVDNEDLHANAQSNWDKVANGLLKGLNLAGTTVAGSLGLLYGVGKSISTGRLADMFDNEISRGLDQWNKKVDNEYLPNYYTEIEKNAAWYSPDNWLKANFLWDKLVKNAGFAAGAVLSGNMAFGVLGRLGSAAGRGAGYLNDAAKTSEAWSMFSKVLQPMSRAFSAGKNIEVAAALEKGVLSALPKAEHFVQATNQIANLAKTTNAYSKFSDVGRRAITALYSSSGEASFETVGTMTQFRENLINEYKETHNGEEPDVATMNQINQQAESVGLVSFFGNVALLSATEYIQMPYLMGSSYRASKQAANSLRGRVSQVAYNKADDIWERAARNKFGKILSNVKGAGVYLFDPKEALQEGGQYALQVGVQNYYNKKYKGEEANSWIDGFMYGVADDKEGLINSKEGMESMLLGGITGGLMQAKGRFQGSRQTTRNTKQFLEDLNDKNFKNSNFAEAYKDKVASLQRAINLQENHEDAVLNDDQLEAKDLEHDMLHNYLTTRIKYGRGDMVKEDIAALKYSASTEEGFESLKAQGLATSTDSRQSYLARLGTVEQHAENIEHLYKAINLRYSGIVDSDKNRVYSNETVDKMVYAASKISDYDNRLNLISNDLIKAGLTPSVNRGNQLNLSPEEQVEADDIILKGIVETMSKIDSMNILPDTKEDFKQSFKDYLEITERRNLYIKEYQELKDTPEKYGDIAPQKEATVTEDPSTIKVKTLDGEEDLEVGTEYFLGRITEKSKHGKEVYRAPRLTILGKNADGTIKIKDSNGYVKDISAEALADYKLGKVSDTMKNKKAKFFMENWNTIYKLKLGKGKSLTGRLEYSTKKDTLIFKYKDASGKTQEREVLNKNFVPQKGYKEALITPIGTLTVEQQKAQEEFGNSTDSRAEQVRAGRLAVIAELAEETWNRLTSNEKLIAEKQAQLETIQEELEGVQKKIDSSVPTERNNFKKTTKAALKTARRLSELKRTLEQEIINLQADQQQLELNIQYIDDLQANLDELPSEFPLFIKDLEDQKGELESVYLETGLAINKYTDLIGKVQKTIDQAIDFAKSLINKYETKYPGYPTNIKDLLEQLERKLALNESNIRLGIPRQVDVLDKEGRVEIEADLKALESEIVQLEDLDINPGERTINELNDAIEEIYKELDNVTKELKSRQVILDKFRQKEKDFRARKVAEDRLKNDEVLKAKIFKTQTEAEASSGIVATGEDPKDEDTFPKESKKKTLYEIINSTTVPGDKAEMKPHHHREQRLLHRLSFLPNRSKIKGIKITKNNEDFYGLTGLTSLVNNNYMPETEVTNPDSGIVTVVYVQEEANGFDYIDQNGNILSGDADLNQLVFNVMTSTDPFHDEKYNDPKTGRRSPKARNNETSEQIQAAFDAYKIRREEIFGWTDKIEAFDIIVSAGIPIYDEDTTAQNNITEVGIPQSEIDNKGLIQISTSGNIADQKGILHTVPNGRPVLNTPTGLRYLNNRKFTESEIDNLINVIKKLAENLNVLNDLDSGIIRYLQGQLFWMSPKKDSKIPIHPNQIWVDLATHELVIGNNGVRVSMTSGTIEENRDALRVFISSVYSNVNKALLDKHEPYFELTADKNGNVKVTEWKTYQHYLLSPTNNGNTRSNPTPLFTKLRKIKTDDDYNSIRYATLSDTEIPEVKQKEAIVTLAPTPKSTVTLKYQPDGKTVYDYVTRSGEIIKFKVKTDGRVVLQPESQGVIEKMMELVKDLPQVKEISELLKSYGLPNGPKESQREFIIKVIEDTVKDENEEVIRQQKKADEDKAAAEKKAEAIVVEAEEEDDPEILEIRRKAGNRVDEEEESAYRRAFDKSMAPITQMETDEFNSWMAENLPNVPVKRVQHLISITNGGTAWGKFEKAMITLFEDAPSGTGHHEAFEAVWKMFISENEKRAILDEQRKRKGTFQDITTDKTISFTQASDLQLKEYVAEQFIDYIYENKAPLSFLQKLSKFFKDLVSFFKNLINKPGATEQLFNKINRGFYKAFEVIDIPGVAYSTRIPGIDQQVENDLIKHITATILKDLARDTSNFFNLEANASVFDRAKESIDKIFGARLNNLDKKKQEATSNLQKEQHINDYNNTKNIWRAVSNNWQDAVDNTKEYLQTFNLTFDEDTLTFNDENRSNRNYLQDAMKTDVKKSAPNAIKLLLATLTESVYNEITPGQVLSPPKESRSESINGLQTVQFGKTFIQLLQAVSATNSLDKMMDNLVNLAKGFPNYVRLFQRLRGNLVNGKIDYNNLEVNDWRLLISFFNTFSKQKPQAFIQYIKDGKVYVEGADLNNINNLTVDSWLNNIRSNPNKGMITYKDGYFRVNPEDVRKLPNTPQEQLAFLNKLLHTNMSMEVYGNINHLVAGSVGAIYNRLKTIGGFKKLDAETLAIKGPLNSIANEWNKANRPEVSSVFFGVENTLKQTFNHNNHISFLGNDINESKTLDELYHKRPYLKDSYSANALFLSRFFDESGNKIKGATFDVGYIDGIKDLDRDKVFTQSSLSIGDRLMLEINQNLNGWYYMLSPADSSTEWMVKMGNTIPLTSFDHNIVWDNIYGKFNQYLGDEITLARANRSKNFFTKSKAQKLRFFSTILSPALVTDLESIIKLKNGYNTKLESYLATHQKSINDSIRSYIEAQSEALKTVLIANNKILPGYESYEIPHLLSDQLTSVYGNGALTETQLTNLLNFLTVNYALNAQDLHKVVFGDPLQYKVTEKNNKVILDEAKRVKSFLSPRETMLNRYTPEFDNFANKKYNTAGGVELQPTDIGYTHFRPYLSTVTLQDIKVRAAFADAEHILSHHYGNLDETDATAVSTLGAYRQLLLKRGAWNDDAEALYQYDTAKMRQAVSKRSDKYKYIYSSTALQEHDTELLKKSAPTAYKLAVLKPIVSGNKYQSSHIDPVLDKYSLMPMTYELAEGKGMEDFYLKLLFDRTKEGYSRDYAIVFSGRKVGAEELDDLYNIEDGSVSTLPFTSDVKVDFQTIGIQQETSYQEGKNQTRGSQATKIVTMDMMEFGVPIDTDIKYQVWNKLTKDEKMAASPIYTKIVNHDEALRRLTDAGYEKTLDDLGIVDKGDHFEMNDYNKLSNTLYDNAKDASINVKAAISLNDNGRFPLAFEATSVYSEIKSLIYSIVNRNLVSPKYNGGAKVQVSAALFEKNKRQAVYKNSENKYVKVTDYKSLTPEEQKTVILTSSELGFYTISKDGKIVTGMEVYLPRWFKNRTNMSDEDLLNYLNNTPEGQKVLTGIGFRIPTQGKNAIEVFRVKGFLPDHMGDTVVVPSEITKKTGSDFDIDKLNTYLRNVYFDKKGIPHVVTLHVLDTNSEHQLRTYYEANLLEDYKKFKAKEEQVGQTLSADELLGKVLGSPSDEDETIADIESRYIPSLEEFLISAKGKEIYKFNQEYNRKYRQILENEYFDAIEAIILEPLLFDRLMTPNSAGGELAEVGGIRDKLMDALGLSTKVPSMISRLSVNEARHNAISGQAGVGIVATTLVSHANAQRAALIIKPERIARLSASEREFIPDTAIRLPHNKIMLTDKANPNGRYYTTLSGLKDTAGKFISDKLSAYVDGFVDIVKDWYITEIGGSKNVISTFLFLERIGVSTPTTVYFMNQPIVRDYLQTISNRNETWILNKDIRDLILEKYDNKFTTPVNKINDTKLLSTIKKFYHGKGIASLSDQEKAEQQFILNEFLKYAAIAGHQYGFNMASSYDTARASGPSSFDIKDAKTEKEAEDNLISSVHDILDNTFIGHLANKLEKLQTALGESKIFLTLQPKVRDLLTSIRNTFTIKFMKSEDREKLEDGIATSLIDYIIQTENTKVTTEKISELMQVLGTSVYRRVLTAQYKYNNPFLSALAQVAETADLFNIKLQNRDTDSFTSNVYISSFKELNTTEPQLYKDLIRLAVLQSGNQKSKLSYTRLIPIEDYAKFGATPLNNININSNLEKFKTLNAFLRNNWRNNVFVKKISLLKKDRSGPSGAISQVPSVLRSLGTKTNTSFLYAHPDFGNNIQYPVLKKVTASKDVNGKTVFTTSLYQKVMDPYSNKPYQLRDGAHIYKQINAWGNSIFLQEYYTTPRQSQSDNGTVKVIELDDAYIINYYENAIKAADQTASPSSQSFDDFKDNLPRKNC